MGNRQPRMGHMTRLETRWIEEVIESGLGRAEPFLAKEAVDVLFDSRRKYGGGKLNNIPNKFRMNTVLKKCGKFNYTKNAFNCNVWTLKEEER